MKTLEEKSFDARRISDGTLQVSVKLSDAQEVLKEKDKEIERLRELMQERCRWRLDNTENGCIYSGVCCKYQTLKQQG